jgi:hypothetical protein
VPKKPTIREKTYIPTNDRDHPEPGIPGKNTPIIVNMKEFFKSSAKLTGDDLMSVDEKHHYERESQHDEAYYQQLHLQFQNCEQGGHKLRLMMRNGISSVKERVITFCKCNLSELDDIDENGRINYEYVNCDHKGASQPTCPYGVEKPYCVRKKY